MTQREFIKLATEQFELKGNKAYALKMKAYLKGRYNFFGIMATPRRETFKELWSDHKDFIKTNWKPLVLTLWKKEQREYHYMAMDILSKIEKKLEPEDIDTIEYLITHNSWWDTVDFLASHCIGNILKKDKALMYDKADMYIQSDHMWLQRTGIIFQLFYKKETDKDLLFAQLITAMGGKEFFINKAIGWALRQYSRTNPSAVAEFIDVNRAKMAHLSIKEGSKYL